jgi:hypothetical protein
MWPRSKHRIDEGPCADGLADALQMITNTGTWINNADTKAGLLAAAVAVLVAALAQQTSVLTQVLHAHSRHVWVAFSILVGLVVDLCTSVAALGLALRPRTPHPQTPSRFSFPTIASPAWTRWPEDRDQVAAEAWTQAHLLARIAVGKFRALKVATTATLSSVVLYLEWLLAAALVPKK